MEYRDKLKKRLNLGIAYIVIGILMIMISSVLDNVNPFILSSVFHYEFVLKSYKQTLKYLKD